MSAQTFYRALLYCYPAAFREEYGRQMLLIFAEQMGEARRTGDPLLSARLWLQAAADAFTVAPQEHCHVILQDLRYAFRTMAARPSFTAVAVLSLALGIGANTAIFSLWNGLLHSVLPGVQRPEELVILSNPDMSGSWTGRWDPSDGPRGWLTYSEFEQLRDRAGCFSALMASQSSFSVWMAHVAGGPLEEANGRMVSNEFFQFLGVKPVIGRVFTAGDRSDVPYAVISYRYWQRRFGGRTDALGQPLLLHRAAFTIIGVAPEGFIGETSGQRPDLWIPLGMQPAVSPGQDRLHDTPPSKSMWLNVFGRLKPGVSIAQADAQANAVFHAGLESFYGSLASGARGHEFLDQSLHLQPAARGASATRHDFSNSLTALLAAVGVLLLIACANLANLLLARGTARRPEIALRLSLGASRGRLIRQLVTESLALAAMGAAAGLIVASLLHEALVRMIAQAHGDFQMGFSLDPQVLSFAFAATLAAVLLFGVLPAWQVTRTDAGAVLKENSRGTKGSLAGMRWSRLLVSLQLALSLPLLVGAGLLVRTIYNLQHTDLGFAPQRLLLARVGAREPGDGAARRGNTSQQLLAEIRRIPSVRSASFSDLGLFSGGNSALPIEVEGYAAKDDNGRNSSLDVVGPGYFSTLGIPLTLGRDIAESDSASGPKVCVINESFAHRFFDGRNPLGMRIAAINNEVRTVYQVAGVARNAHTQNLREEVESRFFVPAAQAPLDVSDPFFLIRTMGDAAPVMAAVRQAVERVDGGLTVTRARTIEEQMAPLTAQDRSTAQLALVFGCVALALAAIGLYGVLSFGIARRTGEIAVRLALGANPGLVISMILRETLGVVVTGLALGGGLAYAASRLIDSRLYGVAPHDPLTLFLATLVLLLAALSAAYLPARRASRLDPMVALRQE